MSESKHTPGPWRVEGPSPEGRNPNAGLWDVEGVTNVANACTLHDARLIAAAPELLEALKAAQSALAMMIQPDAIKNSTVLDAFALATQAEAKARAIISKAEGSDQ